MQVALEVFRANVRRSRDLIAIFRAMRIQTTQVLDLTDVLRAALVNTVSSFDLFVHELVRIGMLESYSSERAKTKAFLRFQVTLLGVLEAISNTGSSSWLEQEIRGRLGHQSFQLPDNVADAIRLISEVELWNEMSAMLGIGRRELRDRLSLIVDRRNKIVHEADILPDFAGQTSNLDFRSPIDDSMVENAIDFMEQTGEAIYDLVSNPILQGLTTCGCSNETGAVC